MFQTKGDRRGPGGAKKKEWRRVRGISVAPDPNPAPVDVPWSPAAAAWFIPPGVGRAVARRSDRCRPPTRGGEIHHLRWAAQAAKGDLVLSALDGAAAPLWDGQRCPRGTFQRRSGDVAHLFSLIRKTRAGTAGGLRRQGVGGPRRDRWAGAGEGLLRSRLMGSLACESHGFKLTLRHQTPRRRARKASYGTKRRQNKAAGRGQAGGRYWSACWLSDTPLHPLSLRT